MVSIHTDYYGSDFNRLCNGKKFYRFLNGDLKHHGYQFRLGLNVDVVSDSDGEYSTGALFFYEESKCHIFLKYYDNNCKLATILIPDDARVYVEQNRFTADKFIIESLIDFSDIPDSFWLNVSYKSSDL